MKWMDSITTTVVSWITCLMQVIQLRLTWNTMARLCSLLSHLRRTIKVSLATIFACSLLTTRLFYLTSPSRSWSLLVTSKVITQTQSMAKQSSLLGKQKLHKLIITLLPKTRSHLTILLSTTSKWPRTTDVRQPTPSSTLSTWLVLMFLQALPIGSLASIQKPLNSLYFQQIQKTRGFTHSQ